MGRMPLKCKIAQMCYDSGKFDCRVIKIRKSFEEIIRILNGPDKNRDNRKK